MREAVKIAKEFGYILPEPCEVDGITIYHKGDTILDPLFWQAIGKALGYKDPDYFARIKFFEWCKVHMLGGDEDKFWKDLLNY